MAKKRLEGLKSRKSGIWGQNDVVVALLGLKGHRFGAPYAFYKKKKHKV